MGLEILQENMPRPQVRTHPGQMGDQTDRSAKNNAVSTAENPYNMLLVFFNERVHGILLEIGCQNGTQPAYQGWMPFSFQRLRMILWFRPSAQPKGRAVQVFGHRHSGLPAGPRGRPRCHSRAGGNPGSFGCFLDPCPFGYAQGGLCAGVTKSASNSIIRSCQDIFTHTQRVGAEVLGEDPFGPCRAVCGRSGHPLGWPRGARQAQRPIAFDDAGWHRGKAPAVFRMTHLRQDVLTHSKAGHSRAWREKY